ncbi:hypothetical protein KDH_10530 [Dictyobacter sp. S3.2.2.5]|uniref:Uncharacterized protein n=1 Tax=Dictyobacter halimunensis TaxID=3026934 RepID=A0ABQ6FJ78_9CHLR|nr:hypothetical protein KDH_10530 [Dictyobacter sp. S3.2.2.5]
MHVFAKSISYFTMVPRGKKGVNDRFYHLHAQAGTLAYSLLTSIITSAILR